MISRGLPRRRASVVLAWPARGASPAAFRLSVAVVSRGLPASRPMSSREDLARTSRHPARRLGTESFVRQHSVYTLASTMRGVYTHPAIGFGWNCFRPLLFCAGAKRPRRKITPPCDIESECLPTETTRAKTVCGVRVTSPRSPVIEPDKPSCAKLARGVRARSETGSNGKNSGEARVAGAAEEHSNFGRFQDQPLRWPTQHGARAIASAAIHHYDIRAGRDVDHSNKHRRRVLRRVLRRCNKHRRRVLRRVLRHCAVSKSRDACAL